MTNAKNVKTFIKGGDYQGGEISRDRRVCYRDVYCEIQTLNSDGSLKLWGEIFGVDTPTYADMVHEVMLILNLRNFKCTDATELQILKSITLDPREEDYVYRADW